MIKVKFENGGKMVSKHIGDSGYDVNAVSYTRVSTDGQLLNKHILKDNETVSIQPHETILIGTGVFLELPQPVDKGEYYEIIEAQVRPRSGLSLKEGLVAQLGTIDCGYKEEVGIILHNNSAYWKTIVKGDRVAQIVFNAIIKPKELIEITNLSESDRNGGFGSTGKQ